MLSPDTGRNRPAAPPSKRGRWGSQRGAVLAQVAAAFIGLHRSSARSSSTTACCGRRAARRRTPRTPPRWPRRSPSASLIRPIKRWRAPRPSTPPRRTPYLGAGPRHHGGGYHVPSVPRRRAGGRHERRRQRVTSLPGSAAPVRGCPLLDDDAPRRPPRRQQGRAHHRPPPHGRGRRLAAYRVKPFAIPDKWTELRNNQGPAGWDVTDSFERDKLNGGLRSAMSPADLYTPPTKRQSGQQRDRLRRRLPTTASS